MKYAILICFFLFCSQSKSFGKKINFKKYAKGYQHLKKEKYDSAFLLFTQFKQQYAKQLKTKKYVVLSKNVDSFINCCNRKLELLRKNNYGGTPTVGNMQSKLQVKESIRYKDIKEGSSKESKHYNKSGEKREGWGGSDKKSGRD